MILAFTTCRFALELVVLAFPRLTREPGCTRLFIAICALFPRFPSFRDCAAKTVAQQF